MKQIGILFVGAAALFAGCVGDDPGAEELGAEAPKAEELGEDSSGSDCYEALLNSDRDSGVHQMYVGILLPNTGKALKPFDGPLTLDIAEEAISLMGQELGCSTDAKPIVRKDGGHAQCTEVVTGQYYTTSCYVETQQGAFFVTTDAQDGVNLVYNRPD